MREYASVSPQFWIGETGKSLRGNPEAQVLALYLMTSPHANMIGVFHCPVLYMAHETGLGIEGASKGLARLIEAGFCEYDEASETVFVVKMAAFQVGAQLKRDDKKVLGIQRAYQNIAVTRMKSRFFQVYRSAYFLPCDEENEEKSKPLASPLQAPPKQLTGTGTGAGVEAPSPSAPPDPRGSRLPADWTLPDDWRVWAESERPDLDVPTVAAGFRDFWVGKAGKDARKADWKATWRNWVRGQNSKPGQGRKVQGEVFV